MDWIDRLNASVNYLEEHLTEDIDYGKAAQTACCSVYHYQRIFAYLAGIPLSEYLRRRRMSLAAADLLAGEKVVEVVPVIRLAPRAQDMAVWAMGRISL